MNAGLKPEHRRRIVEILAANPKVRRVVLFGSRARGQARSASDIDLALYGEGLSLADLAALQVALEETDIPQRVDLVRVDETLDPALRRRIETEGVEWFCRPEEEAAP